MLAVTGNGYLNLDDVLRSLRQLGDQLKAVSYLIAFVILVVGTMDGFLKPQLTRFLQHLARLVCLVALIWGQAPIQSLLTRTVDGLTAQTVALTMQDYAGQYHVAAVGTRLDVAALQAIIDAKVTPSRASAHQTSNGQGWLAWWGGQAVDGLKTWAGQAFASVVYGMIYAGLRACALIALLTNFLQQLILVLLGIWYPIGVAQLSVTGLKAVGTHFLTTLVGVSVWPVGMVFVNLVACALLAGITPAAPGDLLPMLMMIVYLIPVLLWLLVGSFFAPIFAQKLVTHGGAALQSTLGAMISTTSAVTGGLLGGTLAGLGDAFVPRKGSGGHGGGFSSGAGSAVNAGGGSTAASGSAAGQRSGAISYPDVGALGRVAAGRAFKAAGGTVRRLGDLGEALGAVVSEADDRGRPASNAVQNALRPVSLNLSSLRAREYVR